ncbi:putative LPS assembly protein LptD [Mesonia maritima]|uniref:Lipopolysaccharide assembly outer membrane protein LptD (OstA) n=1 Tax=Mesonia maritima TaxID=1793873 RepID=A0ABU1K7R3_9FLAO|nr:putative LPS assembly protein LptD [Mesonia maritima]MDR6301643.1 lipopolysaccharide assembly outer membrane protein LptD (OstA) [Mesonia maritima]
MRTNLPYILFILLVIFFGNSAHAQEIDTITRPRIPAVEENEPQPIDSIQLTEKDNLRETDSMQLDSVKPKQSFLSSDVNYSAKDYIRFDRKNNRVYLYNEAEIVYGDMTIKAGIIILDNTKNEVYAFGIKDSADAYTQRPVFTQLQNTVEPDSIRFNFDTEKALVYNSRTEQGEFKVKGEVTKRENDSVYYMKNVKFTTAPDIENPDYYFFARKIKMVPDKKIVTGLVNLWIADVPTPLGLPFGYFPLTDERASGFIIPSFGDNQNRGYFLQNGGYYFALSDFVDLTVLGDYYTNGSYGLRFESNYANRYQYRGNASFRYEKLLNEERGFPNFSEQSIYNLRWTHTQDQKANPSSRFQASVNLGSSTYYQQTINQTNTGNFLNNSMNSSVSYSKTFEGDPQVNVSLNATHNQNTRTQEINMTLPTLQGSVSRIYPFASGSGTKKGIIENINLQYNIRGENRFRTTDSLFFKPEMFENMISGVQHTIPINTNFKVLNYFSVSAGTNLQENWVFKTYEKSYDAQRQEEVIDTVNGFDAYRTYNFNSSIGTTIYGLFKFNPDSKIKAIRHVIRPSLSYNINPKFDQFYDSYLIPATSGLDEKTVKYSRFENTLFGAPSRRYSSSVGLSVTNDFEAKIEAKDSLAEEPRKISLLKNLQFSTSYDLAADSLKLTPVTIRGTLPVVQDKFDINFNGALDPYALNNKNQRIDKLNINNGGSLFRLTRANVSFGYSFSSSDFTGGEKNPDELENETFRNGGRPDDLFGKSMDQDGQFYDEYEEEEEEEIVENDTERYNYKIPWDLRLSYTMTYDNATRNSEISSHSIMFSGNVELSPRWSVGASSGYDLKNKGFTYTQLRFARDLESWRMTFNWTPFGNRASWYFFIGIKASVLSDIKYDKNRERDRSL